MKRALSGIAFMLFLALQCFAQTIPGNYNLVPNGGFEHLPNAYHATSSLGTMYLFDDTSFLSSPTCWIKATWPFSAIVSDSGSIPSTPNSYPPGHSGRYSLQIYDHFNVPYKLSTMHVVDSSTAVPTRNVRYVETKLLKPLSAGVKYKFTMYVGYFKAVTTNTRTQNTDRIMILGNLGVHFSASNIADFATSSGLKVTPQIRFTTWPTPVADTFAFAKLTATYVAQGGETYMTIGNFDYFNQLVVLHVAPDFLASQSVTRDTIRTIFSRRYIDDVSLVEDTTRPMMPPPTFSLGPDTNVCTTSSYVIGGEPGFLSYLWNTGDTTRLKTITASGKYWCRVDNGCKQYTDTIMVNLGAPPTPFHIFDSALCMNKPFKAFAPKGFAQYLWSNGSRADSAQFSVPGTHWARITSTCGASYTDTFRLVATAGVIPGININTHPPIVLCDGTPTTFFTNIVNGGFAPTYQWYKNGVLLPGAVSGSYTDSLLINGDTMTVVLYSSAACPLTQPTMSNRVGATVYPNLSTAVGITAVPDSIVAGTPVTFTATAVNGGPRPSYVWYLNSMPIPFDTTDTWIAYNLKNGDEVTVRMESSVPCPVPVNAWSAPKQMYAYSTGLVNLRSGQTGISLYPNPVSGMLTVELSFAVQDAKLSLSDALGRTVFAEALDRSKSTFDLSGLPAGVYVCRVRLADGRNYLAKLVKQ